MKQIKIGNIIIFCLLVSIGAIVVGCSGSDEKNGEDGNNKEINEEPGNKQKTLAVGEEVTIKGLSVELTSSVEVTTNSEGVVMSYEGEIEGDLLENSSITIGGKEITLASGAISFYKDKSLQSGTLAESVYVTVSNEVYHLTGAITFNDDETVDLANIAEADKTQIDGGEIHTVGEMDYVFKTMGIIKDGVNITSAVLYVDTTVDVVDTVGAVTNTFSFTSNTGISFYTDGSVKSGTLKSNTSAITIPASGTASYTFTNNTNISFYDDGSVKSGTLASDTSAISIGGTNYTFTSTNISFYDDGSVKSGTLAENVSVTGYTLTGAIAFNDDETVDLANTAKTPINGGTPTAPVAPAGGETHTVGGRDYTFKTGSILRDGTNITNAVLYVDTIVDVVDTVGAVTNTFSFTSTTGISFYTDGSVKSGTLASNTSAITIPASGGTAIIPLRIQTFHSTRMGR